MSEESRTSATKSTHRAAQVSLKHLVSEAGAGVGLPNQPAARKALLYVALAWSLFQLWIASPLQFALGIFVFGETQARCIHLAFALFLAFIGYSSLRKPAQEENPKRDWVLAILAAFSAAYLALFFNSLAHRPGISTWYDTAIACTGMLLLLLAVRRMLGWPLAIVVALFLAYTFAGTHLPALMAHKNHSLAKVMSRQWLTTEGVFGVPLGVSTSFVFLFVLFGALMEKAGAGNYFVTLAYSLLGHGRGGAAKAAVLSSALTGMISGSSVANVMTTGKITIPLMKRAGFTAEKAGAIEAAASVNGQIMPPVMGAAAFLMAEYVGVPYINIIRHALLPAVISYIALIYMVHLEAVKEGIAPLASAHARSLKKRLLAWGIVLSSLGMVASGAYYALSLVKNTAHTMTGWVSALMLCAVYTALVWFKARLDDLEHSKPGTKPVVLPDTLKIVGTGLHFLLPVIVLVWCLVVERMPPGLSAFWAVVMMIVILVTQRPLTAFFRGERSEMRHAWRRGLGELLAGLITGARNMVSISIGMAAAGIILGTVSLTGLSQVMTEIVGLVSGGSFLLALLFTAAISLLLGMGLPTTANYVVVASLLAPVVVELGAQNGISVPLVAVHLFVFYFGIMADVAPMGLASLAAAKIAGSDPVSTGTQAFLYGCRTLILPFLFIYNNELLLLNVDTVWVGLMVFAVATVALLLFASALQGYFYTRSKSLESALLLVCAVSLLYPRLWMNLIAPPFEEAQSDKIEQAAEQVPPGDKLKLHVRGQDSFGDPTELYVLLPLDAIGSGAERIAQAGLFLRHEDGHVFVDDLAFNSSAEEVGLDFQQEIIGVEVQRPQPSKRWIYIPVLVMVTGVLLVQWRRRKMQAA